MELMHRCQMVFFAEEEGSNFELSLMGSRALIGKITTENLKETRVNASDKTAHDIISRAGFNPDNLANDVLKKGDIKAYIEVHIEQGVRLEAEGCSIGIVPAIVGVKWFEVIFKGQSNHSGTTPMNLRHDAMAAASAVISQVKYMAAKATATTVATVGRVEIFPNVPNIIPGYVRFVVNIRDVEQGGIDQVAEELEDAVKLAAADNNMSYELKMLSDIPPITLSSHLTEMLEVNTKELGVDYILMPSGALHDCSCMAEICDAALIFVPSIGGYSHVPEEDTDYEDIKAAADLLLMTLVQLTKS